MYQFVHSGIVSPVSQNNVHLHGSPKESKVALSSPEAHSHFSQHHHQPSIQSIHTPISHHNPPPTPTPAAHQMPQVPQAQKLMATALHPC